MSDCTKVFPDCITGKKSVCVCVCVGLCAGNDLLAAKPWQVIQIQCPADSELWVPHLVLMNWVSEVLGHSWWRWGVSCSLREVEAELAVVQASWGRLLLSSKQPMYTKGKQREMQVTCFFRYCNTALSRWGVVQNAWKGGGSSPAGNKEQRR